MADSNGTRFGWLNLSANGNVRPGRVVVGVTGAGNFLLAVEASTAGTVPPLGISGESTRYPAGDPADDGYNAIAGESIKGLLGPGDIGNAVAGAAITDGGAPLTFDNQGRVVTSAPAAGASDWCIGWPMHTVAAAGEKVQVAVVVPFRNTRPA